MTLNSFYHAICMHLKNSRLQDLLLYLRNLCVILMEEKMRAICTEQQRSNEDSDLRKISYKKLWKLLIDKDLNKKTLSQLANISQSTLTKMSKGESVNIEMLVRICNALDCEFYDIIELVSDENGDS